MLGALAFFKGQKTNPSRRQNSIELMESIGLAKARCMALHNRDYQSWGWYSCWHYWQVHQSAGVQTHVHTAQINTTCKSATRKFPGLCAQIMPFLEVWLKYRPWILQVIHWMNWHLEAFTCTCFQTNWSTCTFKFSAVKIFHLLFKIMLFCSPTLKDVAHKHCPLVRSGEKRLSIFKNWGRVTIRIKETSWDCRNHIHRPQNDTYFVRLLLAQSHWKHLMWQNCPGSPNVLQNKQRERTAISFKHLMTVFSNSLLSFRLKMWHLISHLAVIIVYVGG